MSFAFEDILFYYYGVRLTFYVLFVTRVFFCMYFDLFCIKLCFIFLFANVRACDSFF